MRLVKKDFEVQRLMLGIGVKVFLFCLLSGRVVGAEQLAETTPAEYRALLHAMGQQQDQLTASLIQTAFQQPEIYPAFFETGALDFVYQNRCTQGFAFFDSLYSSGKFQGDALGALATIRHHEHKNDESLQYLRQALEQRCQAMRPYELFVIKSFEMDTSAMALQFLTRLAALYPDNWRYRFALAVWHSFARQTEITCAMLSRLLNEGHKHWRVYSALGANLCYLGKNHEALTKYQEGLQYCETIADEEGRARMWHGIAETKFILGEIAEAKSALQQATDLAKQIGNQIFFCRLELTASRILIEEQQWLKARDLLISVREQAIRFAEGNTLLRTYYQLMDLNRVIGKWEEAVENTLKTAAVADSIGLKAYSVDMLSIIAVIDTEAGRYEQALLHLRQLEETARQRGTLLHRIPFLLGMARVLVALERYHEAWPSIIAGIALASESGNVAQLLDLQISKSAVLLHTGKLQEAQTQLRETIVSAHKNGKKLSWLDANVLLAEVYMRSGAVAAAQQLLTQLIGELAETPPYNNYLQIMARLAETYVQQNDLLRAIAIYSATADMIASQTHMLSPGSLSALSAEERAIYFGLSRAYLRIGEKEKALAITENAHDLVVRRKQWQARLLRNAEVDENERQRLTSADSLLLALRLQQAAVRSPAEALTLEGQIRSLSQQRSAILTHMLPALPAQTMSPADFHLDEFQRMLRERNELAIKFFVGPAHSLVFFLDGDTFATREIAVGHARLKELLTRINTLLTPTHDPKDSSYHAKLDTAAAYEAYQLLLADWIKGREATRLAIVPDDVLHALPFDLLVMTAPAQPTEFLVQRFVIRNGITFASLQQEAQPLWRVQSLLMLADPALPIATPPALSLHRDEGIFPPVGRKELEAVQKIVRVGRLLTGEQASKMLFFPALQTSDWLHFASHSVGRPSEPLFNEFILAIPPHATSPERAYAFEIFQMQLMTKLAILSGCETARGTFFNGEGFEGFVQAFRAAGTPSVIASLWKVDDHATAEFFKSYYEELLRGKSTNTALQSAKLKMLADTRFTVLDWAAFNYYGNDWQVEMPKAGMPLSYRIILITIIIALTAVAFFYSRRRLQIVKE
ncbi:CHAT domain-containing protein [candidate division KSB1 bacterium]|nr:CHAT domain-containing protein [candidate division KSB1 bacterium]